VTRVNPCPYCGQIHREGARFCPTTGKLLEINHPDTNIEKVIGGQTGKLPPHTILHERFLIIDKIGHGGMAAVYRASDIQNPGTSWAVKEMSDIALTDPQERLYAIKSFQQEANLLRTLNHPNLPKVIDFFAEGSKHYLVMEYIPGETLGNILKNKQEPFSEQEVLNWSLQLCNVLIYLHSQHPPIIFRDIKPNNIMLTPKGQVKLIDFGIVRFFKPGKERDTLALGTPGFIAPEAVSGQTDERSDIYSLCVTMHHLLTGQNPAQFLFNLPPVKSINPSVSTQMEQILSKGTETERKARWANAGELYNALLSLTDSTSTKTSLAGTGTVGTLQTLAIPLNQGNVKAEYTQASTNAPIFQKQTSRPTTRLLIVASQLSTWQLILVALLFVALLIFGTWILAPVLADLDFNWNTIPIMALFGAFGYAAYPKRGAVFLSHLLLTSALVATISLRLGSQGYDWQTYTLAVVLSGIAMEIWVSFLPLIKGSTNHESWGRELIWLGLMEIIGMILFFAILMGWETALTPLMWGISALFSGIGWFIGDLIRQYLLNRKTGYLNLR